MPETIKKPIFRNSVGDGCVVGTPIVADVGGEAAILFCFVFLYISAAGAGAFSLDSVWQAQRRGWRAVFAAR